MSPMDQDDPTTFHVRRAISGSNESFEWLVRRFEGLLLAQARVRLARVDISSCSPEDLVQDAWAIAYRKLESTLSPWLRDGKRLTPRLLLFLASILRNRCRNLFRSEIRRRRSGSALEYGTRTTLLQQVPDATRGILTRIGQSEESIAVLRAIEDLEELDRRIIVLRAIEGESVSVAAQILELRPNTLSKRYNRSLTKLRQRLTGSVFDEIELDPDSVKDQGEKQ